MRELILNSLLAFQVLVSVVLTAVLMSRPPLAIQPADPPQVVAASPATPASQPPDPSLPRAVWFHQGGGRYAAINPDEALYQRTWLQMRAILSRSMGRSHLWQMAGPMELVQAAAQPLVGADFALALPPGEWARLWESADAGVGGLIRGPVYEGSEGPVERVVLTLTAPDASIYLLGARGTMRLPLLETDREELERTVRSMNPRAFPKLRLLSLSEPDDVAPEPEKGHLSSLLADDVAPWVLIPADDVSAAFPLVRPQSPDPLPYLTRFFPDVSVVRQIQEQDGSVAYTDGRRGMRMNVYGALEYFEAPEFSGSVAAPDLLRAVQVARDFIFSRGLWSVDATLSGFGRLGQESRLTFGLRRPLLPWVSVRPVMEVRVVGERVVYFYRSPDYIPVASGGNEKLITPEEALHRLKATLAGRPMRVRTMYLAHQLGPGNLQALSLMWCVGMQDGDTYLVDARSGQVLQ